MSSMRSSAIIAAIATIFTSSSYSMFHNEPPTLDLGAMLKEMEIERAKLEEKFSESSSQPMQVDESNSYYRFGNFIISHSSVLALQKIKQIIAAQQLPEPKKNGGQSCRNLKPRLKKRSAPKMYECGDCGKMFRKKGNLREHLDAYH